ncbi:MAG TPA: ABC transporter permease subunit [Candidatus Dormibacteraeota bacterium]
MAWSRPRRWATGYWLSLPALAVVVLVLGYPLLYDVTLSFTGAHEFSASGPFVGFANYQRLFASYGFWEGVSVLLFWIPITVLAEVLIGLSTALLLWWRFWGRTLLFLAVFIPWAFPSAFSAFAFYSLFVPPFPAFYQHGAVVMRFWFDDHFGRGTFDFAAYGVMITWRLSSIMAVFLLAGLNTIPRDLLDYARLEARSPLVYLLRVIVPLLRRYLVLAVMVGAVITFVGFDSIYIESGNRTIVPIVGTLAYLHGIVYGDSGYAAAINVVSLPFVLLVAIVGLRWIGPDRQPRDRSGPERTSMLTLAAAPERLQRRPYSPRRPWLSWRWRRRLLYLGGGAAAILIAAFHIFPVYFVYNQAVVPLQELYLGQPFLVHHPDFATFQQALAPGPLWQWAFNTLVAFGAAILVGVSLGMLAGYGLARFRPPGSETLAKLIFASFFVPQFAIVIPLYQVYNWTGLDNSLQGLVAIYLTMVIPFATWLFYAYFQGLDPSAEEHAWLDASRARAFFSVVVPMARPVFIAAALFSVGVLGSDVVYASTLALSDTAKTLPVGLGLSAISLDEWANVSADVLMASIPLIALCAALGRTFVQGIEAALLEGA